MSAERELVPWSAEVNPEVARLAAWMREHPYAEARLAPRPTHRGILVATPTTFPDGRTSTAVRVRDSRKRGGRQYAVVHRLADLEVKVGARYRPAAEVIGQA